MSDETKPNDAPTELERVKDDAGPLGHLIALPRLSTTGEAIESWKKLVASTKEGIRARIAYVYKVFHQPFLPDPNSEQVLESEEEPELIPVPTDEKGEAIPLFGQIKSIVNRFFTVNDVIDYNECVTGVGSISLVIAMCAYGYLPEPLQKTRLLKKVSPRRIELIALNLSFVIATAHFYLFYKDCRKDNALLAEKLEQQ